MKKALLVIDHGSKRKAANHMLFEVVKLLRNACTDVLVQGAHMELAAPSIEWSINYLIEHGATHIIAHPYMLSPGRHATEDIPKMVEDALKKFPKITFEVTEPLGVDALLVKLILKRSNLN